MSATITLKINTTDDVTAAKVRNLVRAAMSKGELTEDSGEVGGVRYTIKRAKPKQVTAAGAIRIWGRENGFTVGKRGVLAPALVEAYQKANA